MNCPKCEVALQEYEYKGIDVEKCTNCEGMWFDYQELDELEDVEFSIDELKGSLIHRPEAVQIKCPHCGKTLKSFQYRLYDLHLEYCEDLHGFWLDAGEEKQVMSVMAQREKDMNRKFKAEAEWAKTLKQFRRKSFLDQLKNMFSK